VASAGITAAAAVSRANVTVSLASSGNTVFGHQVTFTATVAAHAGTPTGTVNFYDGAALIGTSPVVAGKAALPTASLLGGQHKIKAVYSGDPLFNPGNSVVLTQTVVRTGSSITLSSPATAVPVGQPVVLSVQVSANTAGLGTPTGTITLKDGAKVIATAAVGADGSADFSIPGLAIGPHAVTATYSGDGNFVGSGTGTLQQFVGTPNERYINAIYMSVLHRPADGGGLAAWTAMLNQGTPRATVVTGIMSSPEYRMVQVQGLYQAILGRAADAAGLNLFVGYLQSGWTVQQVEASLLGSGEFYTRAGGTDKGFVDALYQFALGRQAEAGGEAAWEGSLAGGASRSAVAFGILNSSEGLRYTANGAYQFALGRPADPAGSDALVAYFQAGNRLELAVAGLLSSDEFFNKV
jgi:hypothetical protein